jgi:Tfp pilus assembly protein PilF
LPSIGIFLLLGILFDHLWRMGRARRAIGSLVFVLWIAFLTVTTIRHTPVWANDEALYRAAIEAYPKTALALNNLGSELMDQGRYEEAMDVLDRAITLGGHYVVPYVNKGHLFRKMRRDDDAVLAYESGISAVRSSGRLLTDDLLPFYALSEFYEKNGRMALAKDAQRRAADLAREYPEPQIQFGIFLFDHDMPDEAITAFERAIDVDPENILAHYLLAGVYLSQNTLRDAEKKLAIVVRISPSYENAAERLATIRELLGQ